MTEDRSSETGSLAADGSGSPPLVATDPSAELMRLINGYQVSQALHAAAVLGVADYLKDEPRTSDTLARACGAHPALFYRLLRALAAVGVFREADTGEFS